jgi:ribosomal-protein-alanine N-acetyltransferase
MKVRQVCPDDWLAIETLHSRAHRALPQMWPWEEHLAYEAFVVAEHNRNMVGALFAYPDESPVAWVRVAALEDELDINAWLGQSLPAMVDGLRPSGSRVLAWMDYGDWAGTHLQAHGFEPLTDVVTYSKFDQSLPPLDVTDVRMVPASDRDIPAIVAIDRAAFAPYWWQSEDTVRRRAAASAHFHVARVGEELVGYAEGELRLPIAHLNRIAVIPSYQGRGIGAALLRGALRGFWKQRAEWVTLNTQAHNRSSQRLYHRFGFEATGDSVAVWELRI